jgi:putative lysine transport system permease protein
MVYLTAMPNDFFGGIIYLLLQNYKLYFQGVLYTLIIAISGTVLGLLVGLLITILRLQENHEDDSLHMRVVKRISVVFGSGYVEFFRGTPMMVQAAIFYYGLATLGVRLPILLAGIIVVTINTAAYLSEVLRSGINALDKGQMEAARALGMTRVQSYRYIIFPQVLRHMVPAIGNELVVNIKDTAVLSVIGVAELFYMGKSIAGTHYRYTEAFVLVDLIYLIIVVMTTLLLTFIIKRIDREATFKLSSQTTEGGRL